MLLNIFLCDIPPWHSRSKLCGRQHLILFWFKNFKYANKVRERSRNAVTMVQREENKNEHWQVSFTYKYNKESFLFLALSLCFAYLRKFQPIKSPSIYCQFSFICFIFCFYMTVSCRVFWQILLRRSIFLEIWHLKVRFDKSEKSQNVSFESDSLLLFLNWVIAFLLLIVENNSRKIYDPLQIRIY